MLLFSKQSGCNVVVAYLIKETDTSRCTSNGLFITIFTLCEKVPKEAHLGLERSDLNFNAFYIYLQLMATLF